MKKYPLVYLEWQDACSYDGSAEVGSWKSEEEAVEWGKNAEWYVRQAGFIIKENKKYITIAGMCEPGNNDHVPMFGHLQKIPKTWIRKRKLLKV